MLKYWVWLSELKGLRNQTKLALLRRFGDPESIFYADPDELMQHGAGHMVECSLNRAHLFDPCCFVHSVPFSPDKFSVKPASPSGTMRKLVKSAHGAKYRQMDG